MCVCKITQWQDYERIWRRRWWMSGVLPLTHHKVFTTWPWNDRKTQTLDPTSVIRRHLREYDNQFSVIFICHVFGYRIKQLRIFTLVKKKKKIDFKLVALEFCSSKPDQTETQKKRPYINKVIEIKWTWQTMTQMNNSGFQFFNDQDVLHKQRLTLLGGF